MRYQKKSLIIISFIALWMSLFSLALEKHKAFGLYNYQSELWADKSGYYVYLPAAHLYGFDASAFPAEVDENTGQGFKLDSASGKVITKYTYGVALMEAPFYFAAHLLAALTEKTTDGFSLLYQKSINLAASFYGAMALVILFMVLRKRFDWIAALLSCSLILFGTNLLYYIIDESGMSHVYSFFLASALIYWWHHRTAQVYMVQALLVGFCAGLAILIRPTNALLLLFIPLSNFNNFSSWWPHVKSLLNAKFIIAAAIGTVLVWLPQFFYWEYLTGEFVYYSYTNEGFQWLEPQFLSSFFAPRNGLFLYSPLYLFLMVWAIVLAIRGSRLALINLSLFAIAAYVFSSWWAWHFGCSFGGRSYIEYLSIFSILMTSTLREIQGIKSNLLKWFVWFLIVACVLYNLKMTYSVTECFFSPDDWDWDRYCKFLKEPVKIPFF